MYFYWTQHRHSTTESICKTRRDGISYDQLLCEDSNFLTVLILYICSHSHNHGDGAAKALYIVLTKAARLPAAILTPKRHRFHLLNNGVIWSSTISCSLHHVRHNLCSPALYPKKKAIAKAQRRHPTSPAQCRDLQQLQHGRLT